MTGDPARAGTVVALRALGLGDTLTAVPALRGLRRAFPGHRLVLACAHPAARLLAVAGVVDDVFPAADLAATPPGLAYGRHVAVNLHGRGPQSHALLAAGRPDALLAFACGPLAGPTWRPDEHEVDRWCRLVTATTGAACGRDDLYLAAPQPDSPRQDVTVVHPGAAGAERRWPVERWAAVVRALVADGHDVVVTGGPGERGLTAALVAAAGLAPRADLGGALSVDGLAALVARARLVLCGDTGVAHLATAYATASVVLFHRVAPAQWGPAVDPDLHVCLHHGDLAAVTVEEVLDGVQSLRWTLTAYPASGAPRSQVPQRSTSESPASEHQPS